MAQSEYQRAIKRLGLSILGAGEVIGVGLTRAYTLGTAWKPSL
jgi:hypothetical protein